MAYRKTEKQTLAPLVQWSKGVASRRSVATDGIHRLNGGNRPILLKNSGPPPDASESQKCWRGEVPQIVLRGIKVQSNALSAPLVTGKTA